MGLWVGDSGVGEDLVGLVEPVGGLPPGGQPVASHGRDRDGVAGVRPVDDEDLVVLDEGVQQGLDLAEELWESAGHEGEFAEQVIDLGHVDVSNARTGLVVQGPDGLGCPLSGFLRGHDAVPDPAGPRFSSSISESRAASN